MKLQLTYVFFTSLFIFFGGSILCAQENEVKKDSTINAQPQYYGLRVGVDLSKPIRSLIDEDYTGLEIVGDFRIKKDYYLAAELGNETRTTDLPNITNTSKGSYIKAGLNYNAYENWYGMNNLVYAGLRAGFSTFSQELDSYTIYTTDPFFGDDTRLDSREFTGLNATWLELKAGIEVELFANIYLGFNVQLKRIVTVAEPEGYANLFIPGFGNVTEERSVGVGYGYTISYLIPIFKK